MNRLSILACATLITFFSCYTYHDNECVTVQQLVTQAVHKAAASGQVKQLEFLSRQLSAEFTLAMDVADEKYAHTPLHHAVYSGSVPAVRLLLEHGAAANVRCVHGDTPLSFARKGGNPHMIALLIKYGARDDDTKASEITNSNSSAECVLGHE